MVLVVELSLEALEDVGDMGEAMRLERSAGIERALAAAADQDDRAVLAAGHAQHLLCEVRIDIEVRGGVPLDVDRADRVADVIELDLGARVDQQRIRVGLQGLVGLDGGQVFHARLRRRLCGAQPGRTLTAAHMLIPAGDRGAAARRRLIQ